MCDYDDNSYLNCMPPFVSGMPGDFQLPLSLQLVLFVEDFNEDENQSTNDAWERNKINLLKPEVSNLFFS